MNAAPIVVHLSGNVLFQRHLLQELTRRALLREAVLLGPNLEFLRPNSEGQLTLIRNFPAYRESIRLLWALWRRLPAVPQAPLPILRLSFLIDRALSRFLPRCKIFHGLTGVCLHSLQTAKQMGAVCLVDNPTLHPAAWQREVLSECKERAIEPKNSERLMPPWLIQRQEREYQLCDRIVVYSSAARKTFAECPYADKAVVVQPGVDHEAFHTASARKDDVFRVCYVGRIEAAKGIGYLLAAWGRLEMRNAELVMVGRLFPEMSNAIRRASARSSIKCLGILSPSDVQKCYANSTVFVLPSGNEGLSIALLEAMASGLPVIAVEATGAEDCIVSGTNGLLVESRNPEALAAAIEWCRSHSAECEAMGRAARRTIESRFTLGHYAQRMLSVYEVAAHKSMTCEHMRGQGSVLVDLLVPP